MGKRSPTVADLVANPLIIDQLPARVCAAMIVEAQEVITRLAVRIAAAPALEDEPDRVMRDKEAAALLGIGECTLRHKACGSLAHLVVRTGGRRGWSRKRVMEFIRSGGDRIA